MRLAHQELNMRGMTFVDVIVGVAIMLIVFLGIFGAFQVAIELVLTTKAKAGGVALVTEQLEYVRGLPYDSVGTVGGIPSGPIEQLSQETINGILYTVRTLVLYTDAPEDGLGEADSTGVTADYKTIKVEALWSIRGVSRSTSALTRIAPNGVESLAAGGTLRVNVFDALQQPVSGAAVRIENPGVSPAVDLTVYADSQGSIILPGAPVASGYKITVTKDGYSTAKTYDTTVQNPNPNPAHVAVVDAKTTTISFSIDRTGSLRIETYEPAGPGTFEDSFTTDAKLSETTAAQVSGGALKLFEDSFGYSSTGEARSVGVSPAYLSQWSTVTFSVVVPLETSALVRVYSLVDGVSVPIPDEDLPGNSAGFTVSPISLAGVLPSAYPSLQLVAELATEDASSTPQVLEWAMSYVAGPTPLPDVSVSLRGTKTIGTTNGGVPIYKVEQDLETNNNGVVSVTPLEWDTYTVRVPGSQYAVFEQCADPLSIEPAAEETVQLMLVNQDAHSLRVTVLGNAAPVAEAAVVLTGTGGGSGTTSACGQSYFGGLSSGTYSLAISAPGFQNSVQDVSVAGPTVVTVILSP